MLDNNPFTETADASIIEGVGNEVLVVVLVGLFTVILILAWYSTNLTSTQTRLTTPRVHRRGVRLNRLPGSSTIDCRSNRQGAPQQSAAPTQTHSTDATDAIPVEATVDNTQENRLPETTTTSADAAALGERREENLASDVVLDNGTVMTEDAVVTTEEQAMAIESPNIPTAEDASEVTDVVGATTNTEHLDNRPEFVETLTSSDRDTTGGEQTASKASTESVSAAQELSEGVPPQHPAGNPIQESSTEDQSAIRIRIKFLNDNDRVVSAKKADTIASFKQSHFSTELSNNKLVRLIFNGQVLQDDRTLQSYNISDNTAIHALITDVTVPNAQAPMQPTVVVFNAGALMVPLFAIVLSLMWYLRYGFPELFNITSTMSLVSITTVFLYCVSAQRRPVPHGNRHRRYGINVPAAPVTPAAARAN